MILSQLAQGFEIRGSGDPVIGGLSEDSRKIGPGMLFVAVRGAALDGHDYVADAVARGAVAVVAERAVDVPDHVPIVVTGSAREALAGLAARFHGHPAHGLRVIGFTGTFGKTSTSEILRALLAAAGSRPGVLGSLGARYGAFHQPAGGLTTPAPVELHRALQGLRDAGADSAIVEVTSHALLMRRVSGLTFSGGLLAAIMPGEHTDFHRSYEDYVDAKRRFLGYLQPDAVLAFDADNDAARTLAAEAEVRIRSGFSLEGRPAEVRLEHVILDHAGARFTIAGEPMQSALLGRGHLRNVALALAYALQSGVTIQQARDVFRTLTPLRRRMERYEVAGRSLLDDTAAHPDSLRSTFAVASLLSAGLTASRSDSRVTCIYAVRGSRGPDINRRNALSLAELTAHGVDTLIVTASADTAGAPDRVTPEEADAAKQSLQKRGRQFVWEETLTGAARAAMAATRPGDLIVLVGAQGMDGGKSCLELVNS
jgi:UDP-N-acetylmuramoyl-L-alanyl-D-glutamate--2,6-diaminopimelate ligase